jgi:glyoxylase-like metal-dependent hydrolase (beta-lactamase superfamily II)
LLHPAGNILFHGPDHAGFFADHAALFDRHGGVAMHVLTHDAEASRACLTVFRRWGATLRVHERDAAAAQRKAGGAKIAAYGDDARIVTGLQGTHLPGHSPGFTVFRWQGRAGIYLFAGDLLVRTRTGWTAYGDLNGYRASLARLRRMRFDFLLPNKSTPDSAPPLRLVGAERDHAAREALASIERRRDG